MRLEGLASKGNPENVFLKIKDTVKKGTHIINTSDTILDILELLKDSKNKRHDIAASFQKEIGVSFANVAVNIANKHGIRRIGLTGGVAYNYSFSEAIKETVTQLGLEFLEHNLIPPGDAGISIGQLIGGLFRYLKTI